MGYFRSSLNTALDMSKIAVAVIKDGDAAGVDNEFNLPDHFIWTGSNNNFRRVLIGDNATVVDLSTNATQYTVLDLVIGNNVIVDGEGGTNALSKIDIRKSLIVGDNCNLFNAFSSTSSDLLLTSLNEIRIGNNCNIGNAFTNRMKYYPNSYNVSVHIGDAASCANTFYGCSFFTPPEIYINSLTNCYHMFAEDGWLNCPVTIRGYQNELTDTNGVFQRCSQLNSVISFENVSKVTDISHMFYACTNFNQPLDLSPFSSVNRMDNCLAGCRCLNQSVQLPRSSGVLINAHRMFYDCWAFNQNVIIPENYYILTQMFMDCQNLNQNIQLPHTSGLICNSMFYNCLNQRQTMFIPKNTADIRGMFGFGMGGMSIADEGFDIYINNSSMAKTNVSGLIYGRNFNGGRQMNVYCPNIAVINGNTNDNSILGAPITWSAVSGVAGTYINARYNIQISNQYGGGD